MYRMRLSLTVSRGLQVTLRGDELPNLQQVVAEIAEVKAVKSYRGLGIGVEELGEDGQWRGMDYHLWQHLLEPQ